VNDSTFRFWQRWLVAASVFFCVFGIVVALFPNAFFLSMWTEALARAFYDGAEPESAAAFRTFVMGPLGGTIAGSYLLQTFVAVIPFARREPWAWWATLSGLLLWFVVDSSLSISHGAAFNVWMINLMPLIVFVLPLAATRSAFVNSSVRSTP
jgi:hypothetical protein